MNDLYTYVKGKNRKIYEYNRLVYKFTRSDYS